MILDSENKKYVQVEDMKNIGNRELEDLVRVVFGRKKKCEFH